MIVRYTLLIDDASTVDVL